MENEVATLSCCFCFGTASGRSGWLGREGDEVFGCNGVDDCLVGELGETS